MHRQATSRITDSAFPMLASQLRRNPSPERFWCKPGNLGSCDWSVAAARPALDSWRHESGCWLPGVSGCPQVVASSENIQLACVVSCITFGAPKAGVTWTQPAITGRSTWQVHQQGWLAIRSGMARLGWSRTCHQSVDVSREMLAGYIVAGTDVVRHGIDTALGNCPCQQRCCRAQASRGPAMTKNTAYTSHSMDVTLSLATLPKSMCFRLLSTSLQRTTSCTAAAASKQHCIYSNDHHTAVYEHVHLRFVRHSRAAAASITLCRGGMTVMYARVCSPIMPTGCALPSWFKQAAAHLTRCDDL